MKCDLHQLMLDRYSSKEWAIFFEVASRTGSVNKRFADAFVMNLYPSRGLEMHGFEFKTGRSDWVTELNNPDKAEESILAYCDKWWVVAPSGVVKIEEIPISWGYLEASSDSLKVVKEADKRNTGGIPREFLASVLLSAKKWSQDQNQKHYRDGYEQGKSFVKLSGECNQELEKSIREFEQRTGLYIAGGSSELEKAVREFVSSWKADQVDVSTTIASLKRKRAILDSAINLCQNIKLKGAKPNADNV